MALRADIKSCPLFLLLATAALLPLLSGCAALDKNDCLKADWFRIGYADGTRGYRGTRIDAHREACAGQGVKPDSVAYEKGRQKGLTQWCTPANGHRIGLQNGLYNGVCPKDLEPAFVRTLERAKAVYAYENECRKQDQRVKHLHIDLDGMDKDIKDMESELISDSVSPRRRQALRKETRLRRQARRLLLEDIRAAEKTLTDMRANLEQLKARNP